MSDASKEPGIINWRDLTVANAEEIKTFYEKIIGWKSEALSMGEYNDFVMLSPETNNPIAGICHARGVNKELPAQWLIYINVSDIEKSLSACVNLGGKKLTDVKDYAGTGKYCVIQDPAGAVCALFEPM